MSDNEDAKRKAAAAAGTGRGVRLRPLRATNGADVYKTDMILTPSEHGWKANGEKYYIGNANVARMVSTFGKIDGSSNDGEYVFFTADSQHDRYELLKNVVNSQNYVAMEASLYWGVSVALKKGADRDRWRSRRRAAGVGVPAAAGALGPGSGNTPSLCSRWMFCCMFSRTSAGVGASVPRPHATSP